MNKRVALAGGVSKKFAKLKLEDAGKNPDMSSSQGWEYDTRSRRSSRKKTNQGQRIVCMDVLTFAGDFFHIRQKKMPPWDKEVTKARRKVKYFVKAAKNSNIEIIGFIDKSVATEEAIKKWRRRREKELSDGSMGGLPIMNLLLGSIMQEQGITIHYSTIDCDDTIAAFAYNLGADVLSQDSDFFRYYTASTITPFNIFSSFTMGKFLTLTPHPGPNPNKKQRASKREILAPLPDTRSSPYYFLDLPNPVQMNLSKTPAAWESITHCYTRGCGTNLPKMFNNPHLTIRPLRQALYSSMGVDKVMEVMATWNTEEKRPEFREEVVMADPGMMNLLNRPEKAVAILFKGEQRPEDCSSVGWRNQLFAQRAFVAEICAWATGTSVLEILEMLTEDLEVMVTEKVEAVLKKKILKSTLQEGMITDKKGKTPEKGPKSAFEKKPSSASVKPERKFTASFPQLGQNKEKEMKVNKEQKVKLAGKKENRKGKKVRMRSEKENECPENGDGMKITVKDKKKVSASEVKEKKVGTKEVKKVEKEEKKVIA